MVVAWLTGHRGHSVGRKVVLESCVAGFNFSSVCLSPVAIEMLVRGGRQAGSLFDVFEFPL